MTRSGGCWASGSCAREEEARAEQERAKAQQEAEKSKQMAEKTAHLAFQTRMAELKLVKLGLLPVHALSACHPHVTCAPS